MTVNSNSDDLSFSVSVVIPAYNCAGTIKRAVNSILNQTVNVMEIVIVDDESSDDTVDVVIRLMQTVPQIQLHQQTNGGPARARNTGIKQARGEWIAFLDADDAWLPNRLELQKTIVDNNPEINWIGGAFTKIRFDGEGNQTVVGESSKSARLKDASYGVHDALGEIAEGTTVWTGCMLIRRSELEVLEGFDERIKGSEDIDLWVRLAIRNPLIGFVVSPIALYTVDQPNSLVGINARTLDLTKLIFFKSLMDLIEKTEGTQQYCLDKLLRTKIQQYTQNLLRVGESAAARQFTRILKKQKMPLPNLGTRLVALIPSGILKLIRSRVVAARRSTLSNDL